MARKTKPAYAPGRKLGGRVRMLTQSIFRDAGLAPTGPGISMLEDQWSDLLGPRLAGLSAPVKLSGTKAGQVLTIEIVPAAAPVFQHQSETLKSSINAATGLKLRDLKFIQKVPTAKQKGSAPTKPLALNEKRELEAPLEGVQSSHLRKALLAFGVAVYTSRDAPPIGGKDESIDGN